MSIGVIIPAGGSGTRMGSKIEKQFLKLKGKMILEHTLAKFNSHKEIDEIVLVLSQDRILKSGSFFMKKFKKISTVVVGGPERTISVTNGFMGFEKKHNVILIHDSVRPFVDKETISNVIKSTKKYGVTTAAVPVKDTIKIVEKTKVTGTSDRSKLWHTLTPQGFKNKILQDSLEYALSNNIMGTDECMLAESLGKDVRVVNGSYLNFKITTKEDLKMAKALLK